ncbi:MAG: heavy metal translocating P-type ATPase [Pseudonocardiaceae bacterium]
MLTHVTCHSVTTTTAPASGERTAAPPAAFRMWNLPEARWAVAAVMLIAAGGGAQLGGAPPVVWWTLYLACYAAGGWRPGLEGLRALRGRSLDVDLLMVVAAVGAAAIGQVFDGALLIVIFATSGALEAGATQRTAAAVRCLLDVAPAQVTRLLDHDEELMKPADLVVGDVVLARPGERIGADGRVLEGTSEVDQASITGEALPAAKHPGAQVYAGTVNGTGSLRVRVERPAGDTVLARIVAMVEQASATKARTQLFIERFEQHYSVGVVAATLAIFAVPLLAGASLEPALLRAMTFMIVASPCAVVLATMPPLLAAIANAGRHGVLVKSAVVLERIAATTTVAFDKTGTLTTGTPRLVTVTGLDRSADEVLALAAAVEHHSEHPLGAAVVAAARASGLAVPPATGFRSSPGRGVTADVAGRRVAVGRPEAATANEGMSGATRQSLSGTAGEADDLEHSGHTNVVVSVDGAPAGTLDFADDARPDAPTAVTALTALTGRTPVLLTGDDHRAARRLASDLGIDDVRARLLPEDKVDQVQALQRAGQRVLVVGDGVNDAPALATAHTGVAMGGIGSDLALQTADVVLVRDDLAAIPALLALARRARRIMIANLAIAGTVIAVLTTWDLLGHLPLPLGVAGHEGSTILVALNGLRLLSSRTWRRAAGFSASTAQNKPSSWPLPAP